VAVKRDWPNVIGNQRGNVDTRVTAFGFYTPHALLDDIFLLFFTTRSVRGDGKGEKQFLSSRNAARRTIITIAIIPIITIMIIITTIRGRTCVLNFIVLRAGIREHVDSGRRRVSVIDDAIVPAFPSRPFCRRFI